MHVTAAHISGQRPSCPVWLAVHQSCSPCNQPPTAPSSTLAVLGENSLKTVTHLQLIGLGHYCQQRSQQHELHLQQSSGQRARLRQRLNNSLLGLCTCSSIQQPCLASVQLCFAQCSQDLPYSTCSCRTRMLQEVIADSSAAQGRMPSNPGNLRVSLLVQVKI